MCTLISIILNAAWNHISVKEIVLAEYNRLWSDFDRASSLTCGNKMPTRCNRCFFCRSYCLLNMFQAMPIIRSSRVLYSWLLPVVFGALLFKLSVWCGAVGYVSGLRAAVRKPVVAVCGSNNMYNTLELLMMGIVVPETCWASNKICNKNHLLHLVGILFPHIHSTFRTAPDFCEIVSLHCYLVATCTRAACRKCDATVL